MNGGASSGHIHRILSTIWNKLPGLERTPILPKDTADNLPDQHGRNLDFAYSLHTYGVLPYTSMNEGPNLL
jgi:hypothetical protein